MHHKVATEEDILVLRKKWNWPHHHYFGITYVMLIRTFFFLSFVVLVSDESNLLGNRALDSLAVSCWSRKGPIFMKGRAGRAGS